MDETDRDSNDLKSGFREMQRVRERDAKKQRGTVALSLFRLGFWFVTFLRFVSGGLLLKVGGYICLFLIPPLTKYCFCVYVQNSLHSLLSFLFIY